MKEGIVASPAITEAIAINVRKEAEESNCKPFEYRDEDPFAEQPLQPWGVYRSRLIYYQSTFGPVLDNKSLGELVLKKRRPGASALDLMADETVVHEIVDYFRYKNGLAVTLGAPKSELPLGGNPKGNVDLINGDLLTKDTWVKIRRWMNVHSVKGFDLILSRPMGGIYHLTSDSRVHCQLLRNAWSLLRSDGGELLFEIPSSSGQYFNDYTRVLQASNVGVVYNNRIGEKHVARLIRTPESPRVLPKF